MKIRNQVEATNAVLLFLRLGWQIVPVHSAFNGKCSCRKRASCSRPGKHPRDNQWQRKGSSDEAQFRTWWKSPYLNVGVVTGPTSGIVVLDVDGEAGKSTLEKLVSDDPSILKTRIHKTGNGGSHLFFKHPGFPCSNGVKPLPGIDIRADNGLIILPPSLHASGQRYEILKNLPVARLPDSIRPLFEKCHKERQRETKSNNESQCKWLGGSNEIAQQLPPKLSTFENDDQLRWAISSALPTEPGKRHKQVFELARRLQGAGISRETPLVVLRPLVERWHFAAIKQAKQMDFVMRGDVEESWSDFQFAWDRVKYPLGGDLRAVFDHAAVMDADGEVEPIVWNCLSAYGRTEHREMRILCGVLFSLSEAHFPDPFSLACHAAAAQLQRIGYSQIDGKWILRRLKSLARDGVIQCVDSGRSGFGKDRKAAAYLWTWQVVPL